MRITHQQLRRIIWEVMELDLEVGDVILTGKFKNKRKVVKDFGKDDLGQPTINGTKALNFRIEKLMPKDKWSKKSKEALEFAEKVDESKITEKQLRRIIRKQIILEKKWSDFNAVKGKTIDLQPTDFDEDECLEKPCPPEARDLNDEIFDLVQNAYADVSLGGGRFGNIKVRTPTDLPGGYTIMKAVDIDDDPEPDVFRGGKMRRGRHKLGISGHDGSAAAIKRYLEMTAEALLTGGIAEMSGKIATMMITRYGVPAVTSQAQVEAMLGKSVNWVGRHPIEKWAQKYGSNYEGFYTRDISGSTPGAHMKILLGGI